MAVQLFDYELEEWVRGCPVPAAPLSAEQLTWRQRVQYTVGHTINDYCSLTPEVRNCTSIQLLLERRWPKKADGFLGDLHYWKVYARMAEQLSGIFANVSVTDYPVSLYEQWNAYIPELDLHLAMIFQAVWESKGVTGNPFTVQKFMVEEDAEVIKAFVHMTNVFWHSVYGKPPAGIEVYALMSGKKLSFRGETLGLPESLDYVYLLSESVSEDQALLQF
ncbi:hypothetical protein DFP94_11562 [Fontibacillus phaseoli]|uniref:Uncharacterized protein n=1 Tax=Fontibacillus phaseoli TaxID=1416533 RepID=A0A369B486_9BACL|nr:hypothetical protein [Fontibacillus phaseoli]RCX15378.1 hypothetical protein DFP94_11562 [Fontibacillus phaseoli]